MNMVFLMYLVFYSHGSQMKMELMPSMEACENAITALEIYDPNGNFYRKDTIKCITVKK